MNKDIKWKIGQISQNLLGWDFFDENGEKFTKSFNDELNRYSTIGYIYGLLRSDPWSKINFATGIPPEDAAKYLNKFQKAIVDKGDTPAIFVEEAPHGHQGLDGTTLPVNLAVGASFNSKLYEETMSNSAKEIRYKGAHIALLSCLDLGLDPRWGRTEETYGEDTYLAKRMARAAVSGLQGKGNKIAKDKVGALVKHFIGQGSAMGGHNGTSVSMGWNELSTHHLSIMQEAINLDAIGCMAAYNDINGEPCHGNKGLLTDILKNKMGHKGIIMSDGCAIDNLDDITGSQELSIARALEAGVNVDLWNQNFNSLEQSIKNGHLKESVLDKAVEKTLEIKERLGLIDNPYQDESLYSKIDFKAHRAAALKMAEESIVLLENKDSTLPLNNLKDACLIGLHGDNIYHLLGDYTAFQRDDAITLKEALGIPYAKGNNLHKNDETLILEAVELAKSSKQVILTIGSSSKREFDTVFDSNGAAIIDSNKVNNMDCGEGIDLAEVKLSKAQQELFDRLYQVNQNIIVLVISGRPVGIEKVARKAKAVLQVFYPGIMGPEAIKNVLLGKVNPSGRLPISIPYNSSQLPVYYWMKENLKYFDQTNKPLYKFGYGLSYSNITDEVIEIKNKTLVKVRVTNTSDFAGKHSILIFAQLAGCKIKAPKKILVGFEKVLVEGNSFIEINIKCELDWLKEGYDFKSFKLIKN